MATKTEVLQLDPAKVSPGSNIRYSLRSTDVDRMAESILDRGGIEQPVTVRKVGKGYELVTGHIRHAAVLKLNTEGGAGLKLPAIEVDGSNELETLKSQVAENVARASMSPIDTALAIKRLMDSNVSRTDIRKMFARPSGTRGKGLQPASNAWVNIMLSLLDLPKALQTKVHEGHVSYAAAYELGKVPADKREAVLARAEQQAEKEATEEEKDEQRLLKEEQRAGAEAEKLAKLEASIAETSKDTVNAQTVINERKAAWEAAKKVSYEPDDAAAAKAYKESVAAAEKDYKAAQKVAKDFVNKLASLKSQLSKLRDRGTEVEAPKPKATPAKAMVGPADVKKAAKAEGATGLKALNISEARQAFKDIHAARNPQLSEVGGICLRILSGELTPKRAMEEIELVLRAATATGAVPAKKKPAA